MNEYFFKLQDPFPFMRKKQKKIKDDSIEETDYIDLVEPILQRNYGLRYEFCDACVDSSCDEKTCMKFCNECKL